MKKIYTLKCVGGFRDGNAYPRVIANNETLKDVSEQQYRRLLQSDPSGFEVVDVVSVVPPSTKSKPKQESKKKTVVEKAKSEAEKPVEEEGSDGIEG